MELFDLKASRCPDAMIYVRRAISAAVSGDFNGDVEIRTIEGSMLRDLPHYLAQVENVTIIESTSVILTNATREDWVANGEAIDDDLININQQLVFRINIKTTACSLLTSK
ncbi:hypothetical protein HNW13_018505 [Shewanella sp. BF02_Schw]|uniref:hypothetical protein n=1 Tax=Shewanella sp. BF02_Schw TaxID=394908 RepID=UPI001785698E|nr:hypothetical protein [Shewanella sp. BF02_Schw]MBO1897733.1 hypothetical protein [Shewanella sp. BF02_Schw]